MLRPRLWPSARKPPLLALAVLAVFLLALELAVPAGVLPPALRLSPALAALLPVPLVEELVVCPLVLALAELPLVLLPAPALVVLPLVPPLALVLAAPPLVPLVELSHLVLPVVELAAVPRALERAASHLVPRPPPVVEPSLPAQHRAAPAALPTCLVTMSTRI